METKVEFLRKNALLVSLETNNSSFPDLFSCKEWRRVLTPIISKRIGDKPFSIIANMEENIFPDEDVVVKRVILKPKHKVCPQYCAFYNLQYLKINQEILDYVIDDVYFSASAWYIINGAISENEAIDINQDMSLFQKSFNVELVKNFCSRELFCSRGDGESFIWINFPENAFELLSSSFHSNTLFPMLTWA